MQRLYVAPQSRFVAGSSVSRRRAPAVVQAGKRDESRINTDSSALPETFCIIGDKATVRDFAKLQLGEISSAIEVSPARLAYAAIIFRTQRAQ